MGFRTVVVLFNDQASQWQSNPNLGQAIFQASAEAMKHKPGADAELAGYGRVVECRHADEQTLGVFNHYQFQPIAYSHWFSGQTNEAMQLTLLKEAAEKLGYKLVKKAK